MDKSLKELRKEAKERGLKGYSTLSKDQLIQFLSGEIVKKKLKKNQRCKETQTEFKQCFGMCVEYNVVSTNFRG